MTHSAQTVIDQTVAWLEKAVIGLNLCPFARRVHVRHQIHYAVSSACTSQALLEDLRTELSDLVQCAAAQRDTTLLMAPGCLADFLDFNDFLGQADELLVELGLEGVLQIASFHPDYQFAGTAPDDITNFTNRAPYPTLHLIREASLDEALRVFPNAEMIYEANKETLRRLGAHGWAALDLGPTKVSP